MITKFESMISLIMQPERGRKHVAVQIVEDVATQVGNTEYHATILINCRLCRNTY